MDVAALSREEVTARLAAPSAERTAFIRSAAEGGHAEAQAVYGQMLLDGNKVGQDAAAALAWFTRAAAQHHLLALNMVGRCYDLGWGTRIDKVRASECFRVAAERGLAWAMYNYATALALGEGVTLDRIAALAWLERAATEGDRPCRAKALNFIGSFAEDGWAGPVDMARAADHYQRSANQDDFRGCFNHARLLLTSGKTDEANAWIERSLALGNERFRAQVKEWLRLTELSGDASRAVDHQRLERRNAASVDP